MSGVKSKVDKVYEIIINDISNGVYVDGNRLVISQIAEQCGTSQTPVREAIRMLEREGFVKMTANQGAVVKSLNIETLLSHYQIKGVLEAYATRLCIDYLKPEDFVELRAINARLEEAFQEYRTEECSKINVEFHMTMYQKLPYKELALLIDDLWRKWVMTKSSFLRAPQRTLSSIYDHETILQLIEQKQYDRVEQFVREHKFRAGYNMDDFTKDLGKNKIRNG